MYLNIKKNYKIIIGIIIIIMILHVPSGISQYLRYNECNKASGLNQITKCISDYNLNDDVILYLRKQQQIITQTKDITKPDILNMYLIALSSNSLKNTDSDYKFILKELKDCSIYNSECIDFYIRILEEHTRVPITSNEKIKIYENFLNNNKEICNKMLFMINTLN